MKTSIQEKELRPVSGFLGLLLILLGIVLATACFVISAMHLDAYDSPTALWGVLLFLSLLLYIVCFCLFSGLKVVRPNEARVFTLFGKYYGTLKQSGFFYTAPFVTSFGPTIMQEKTNESGAKVQDGSIPATTTVPVTQKHISLKTQTLDNRRQKVNDVLGNPIIIGAVVIWRVENPTMAVFAVENYVEYLSIQTDSIIRNIARLYPYDIFDDDDDDDSVKERTLRSSAIEIADTMRDELQKRVQDAGLVIEEVRITHLAYAEEIAAAMLQRQQAVAIIAARQKIVDGAVGMVKMAIDRLNEDDVVLLDEERKAAMVSNLLVVLCGNKDAQPIVNSGSLY